MTREELLEMETADKVMLIRQGLYLDVFVEDLNVNIRDIAAEQGEVEVNRIVAEFDKLRQSYIDQGYSMDMIDYKRKFIIRAAKHAYGLDKVAKVSRVCVSGELRHKSDKMDQRTSQRHS